MKRIYLDWAATSPINSLVLDRMHDAALQFPGNPSSIHREGKAAADLLHKDRRRCAELLETRKERIFFTSGGTESNAIILNSLLLRKTPGNILVSGIEHPSVFGYLRILKESGYSVTVINPDSTGVLQPHMVEKKLQSGTVMILVMTVNNETGAVQPLEEIVPLVRQFEKKTNRHIHIHTDAVQALGKIPFHAEKLDIDSAAFSAHKIQGPRGAGILYSKRIPEVFSAGGGQENRVRPGTENIPGIHGMTAALEQYLPSIPERMRHAQMLMNALLSEYKTIPELVILDRTPEHSPFIVNASIQYFPGEVFTRIMDDRGFAISPGSACSSRNKNKKSRVLSAMGLPAERAFHSFRVSTGIETTEEDIRSFCRAIKEELTIFRRR